MSLTASSLKSDLKAVFDEMRENTDGDNSIFSKGVAAAAKDFIETATVTTTDAGSVSAGVFVGTGSGTVSADDSDAQSIIQSACEAMKSMTSGGNDYLAGKIASAIQTMSDAAEVKTNVSGTVTLSNGSTSALSGTAEGTLTCSYALESDLKAAFKAMETMTENGDEYLASQMASAINSFVLSGVVSTQGKSSLSGSVGAGGVA